MADPTFDQPGKVELLISAVLLFNILKDSCKKGLTGTHTIRNFELNCKEYYSQSHCRNQTGHYIIRMLSKEKPLREIHSYQLAV